VSAGGLFALHARDYLGRIFKVPAKHRSTMQITWYGHSAFRLDFAGQAVLIDPFFTGNPAFVSDKAAAIKGVSHIVLTHGHSDHVGDALDIAKSNGATVTTSYDLGMWLVSKGLEKLNPMNTGGTTDLGAFTVTLVRADHSSGDMVNGTSVYLGNPNGAIIKAKGEPTVYHLGDTDIFSDMALIAEIHQPKIAFVPIGDRFTMSPTTAAMAVKRFLKVETVVPCHYGSFPIIEPSADKFVAAMKGETTKVIVPEKGKAFQI
jgi:L-ascorbate metabolism protein UlaG (beta-lactamase superfamily)